MRRAALWQRIFRGFCRGLGWYAHGGGNGRRLDRNDIPAMSDCRGGVFAARRFPRPFPSPMPAHLRLPSLCAPHRLRGFARLCVTILRCRVRGPFSAFSFFHYLRGEYLKRCKETYVRA